MVTVHEYARAQGMHPESVRRAIRQGRIKARKRGRGPKKPWLVEAPQAMQTVTQQVDGSIEVVHAPVPQPDYLASVPALEPAPALGWRLLSMVLAVYVALTLAPVLMAAARGAVAMAGALGSMVRAARTESQTPWTAP